MYLDLILVLNFTVNCFLLWLTSFVTEQKTVLTRLMVGSALGAAFFLVALLPVWHPFYTWCGKTLVPLAMVLITFRPRFFGQGILLLMILYLCACVLGGLVLVFSLWGGHPLNFARGIYYLPVPALYYLLFFSGALLFLGARILKPMIIERFNFSFLSAKMEMEINFCGKCKKFSTYLDTGNMLREPFSGLPVAVVAYSVVRELLPLEIERIFGPAGKMDWQQLEKLFKGNNEAAKFCLIPCHTLQGRGFLLGFKPEKIKIWQGGQEMDFPLELMVGIQPGQVHPAAEYDALLPLAIWRSACKQEGFKL